MSIERKSENESITDFTTRYLREQTMNFNILPGSSINEKEIAQKLGISRAPVREALNRLIAEDLVIFRPGKGFFCRELKIEEIEELFEVREDLEIAAIRAAIRSATDEKLKNLLEKSIDNRNKQNEIETHELVIVDEDFHCEVIRLSGNNERLKFIQNINKRIRFVRQISLEMGRRDRFLDEHIQIAQAMYERDEKKAIKSIKYHLRVNSKELSINIRDGLAKIYGLDVGIR
ncbi:GntR family transcriptional regulator [Tepidanaerobacter acetatoxydans]|uniref:GntR family transcriptional regulator n=1 Tax=Tepidanaerobacter acetatoxydans TaxID=499229 RepID=UPI001BD3552F|nr:GntR family transcriptional regulator [Tepidanaerobacter acetatoxydans]